MLTEQRGIHLGSFCISDHFWSNKENISAHMSLDKEKVFYKNLGEVCEKNIWSVSEKYTIQLSKGSVDG